MILAIDTIIASAGPYKRITTKSIGKAIVISPPAGKVIGINSANTVITTKKIKGNHISVNKGMVGSSNI